MAFIRFRNRWISLNHFTAFLSGGAAATGWQNANTPDVLKRLDALAVLARQEGGGLMAAIARAQDAVIDKLASRLVVKVGHVEVGIDYSLHPPLALLLEAGLRQAREDLKPHCSIWIYASASEAAEEIQLPPASSDDDPRLFAAEIAKELQAAPWSIRAAYKQPSRPLVEGGIH